MAFIDWGARAQERICYFLLLVAIYQYRFYPLGLQLALESYSEHNIWQFCWLEHVALPVLVATLPMS
jgi:hypothetical protein